MKFFLCGGNKNNDFNKKNGKMGELYYMKSSWDIHDYMVSDYNFFNNTASDIKKTGWCNH